MRVQAAIDPSDAAMPHPVADEGYMTAPAGKGNTAWPGPATPWPAQEQGIGAWPPRDQSFLVPEDAQSATLMQPLTATRSPARSARQPSQPATPRPAALGGGASHTLHTVVQKQQPGSATKAPPPARQVVAPTVKRCPNCKSVATRVRQKIVCGTCRHCRVRLSVTHASLSCRRDIAVLLPPR